MKKLFAKEKIWRAFLTYTIIFGILSIAIYYLFNISDRSFISSIDSINQHFVTLKNWRYLLINFFKTGEFNTFTWSIGNGIDLFADFSYYIMGDFISYFSVFCPESKLYYFYVAALFIRLYFVGISFIIYSKYKKNNNYSSIIGAICYTFMAFSLLASFRHPYFTNAFILFPLLMLGMDKIVLENKKVFYIFMIFISYISSFYFAYIMSLCLLIYGLILIISTYKKDGIKFIIKKLINVFICSLIGIGLSSFILIPVLNQFLKSNRGEGLSIFDYRFTSSYFANITSSMASYSYDSWAVLGINSIIFIALPIAIKNYKKNHQLLIFTIVLYISLLIPFVASIFSGFSFPTNRQVFVISFIMSLFITEFLNDFNKIEKKDLLFIIIFNLIYYLIALLLCDLDKIVIFTILCTTIYSLIFFYKSNIELFTQKHNFLKRYNCYNIIVIALIVCTTIVYINYFFDYKNNINDFVGKGQIQKTYKTNDNTTPSFSNNINTITNDDEEYYKIGKEESNMQNDSLYLGYNSIDYYYSIVPNIVQQLGYDLSNYTYYTSSEIKQFNYRTKITSLLGTKYYVMNDNQKIPFGYNITKQDKSNIYKNKYFTTFAEYYDTYITKDEYENMSNIEKESSLLKNVVLDKTIKNIIIHNDNYQEEINKNFKTLNFTTTNDSKKIIVTNNEENEKQDNKIIITLNPNQELHGEVYLKIDNLNHKAFTRKELYKIKTTIDKYSDRGFKNKYNNYVEKDTFKLKVMYNEEEVVASYNDRRYDSYSSGSNNVLLNLGYYDNLDDIEDNKLEITLSALGEYTYDNLELLLVTFDDYEDDIANLNKSNYKTLEYKNGYMKGTVDLEKPGIIQFATAYVDGWDLYIDGKKSEILNVNKYFLGTYMEKGKHTIELKYHTPMIKEGAIISLISLIIYIIVIIFDYRKNKVDLKK